MLEKYMEKEQLLNFYSRIKEFSSILFNIGL